VEEHRRAGWYGLGGTLSGLGGLWLVGWGVAVLQSSPPHQLHFLVPVTYIAIALLAGGILLVLAVMFDWPVWLVSRLPELRRPALNVTVKDVQWENFRYIAMIGAFHIRIKNTTGKRVMIASYAFTTDNRGLPSWRGTTSRDQVLEVDREIDQRLGRHRYGPALRNQAEVPAREAISGWVVEAVTRDPAGGTPGCTIVVKDQIGNEYRAVVKRVDPRQASK
jgi:hypothetical protein